MDHSLPHVTIILSAEGHLRLVCAESPLTLGVTRESEGLRKEASYSAIRPFPVCLGDEMPAGLQDSARQFHAGEERLFSPRGDPAETVTDVLELNLPPKVAKRFIAWCARNQRHPGTTLARFIEAGMKGGDR